MRSYLGGVKQLIWRDGAYVTSDDINRLYNGRCYLLGMSIWQIRTADTVPNFLKFFDSGGDLGVVTLADFSNRMTVDFESGNKTIEFASEADKLKTSVDDYITSISTVGETRLTSYIDGGDKANISPDSIATGDTPNTTFDRSTKKAEMFFLNSNQYRDVLQYRIPEDGILFENGLVAYFDSNDAVTNATYGIDVFIR